MLVEAVMILVFILEVPHLNLGRELNYPDEAFHGFSLPSK
jgi:hypothetical protein